MTRQVTATASTDSGATSGPSRAGTPVRPDATATRPAEAAPLEGVVDVASPTGRGFSEWLRTQLAVKRISQRQLAQRSGVDHSTISRLLVGQRLPSLATAIRLARALPELRHGQDGSPHAVGFSTGGAGPTTPIEYALRRDGRLNEFQVRELMEHYLALRHGRAYTQRAKRIDHEPIVAEVSAARSPGSRAAPL